MSEHTLEYHRGPRWSVGAGAALGLSILGALLFFTGILPLVALVAALTVRKRIATRLDVTGQNLATAGVVVSCGALVMFVALMFLPSLGCAHCLSTRSVCAANLRGIGLSIAAYAADNGGAFPVVSYAPYTRALQNPAGVKRAGTAEDVGRAMVTPGFRQAGSVPACLWMLVVNGQVAPKQLICHWDPHATGVASIGDGTGYYDNFQNGQQLSYSAAYPWRVDGTVGPWWRETNDASLPILADMTPLQGTGTPARNVVPASAPGRGVWNSGNHDGDGQNVAFADAHAEFCRSPDVGQGNDNIYSMSGMPSVGPARYGGVAAGFAAPDLRAAAVPFDVVMVPARNLNTGGL